jgi:hypothetical protein
MTHTKDEALKLALGALTPMQNSRDDTAVERAITAIKQALAAPVQVPVAYRVKWPAFGGGYKWVMTDKPTMVDAGFVNEALYTTPPAAPVPPVQGPLSFNCSAGCGACGVKLQDFVTHQTQAQEGDEWVVVAAQPQIVSTCCGSPVEVWDERKQDITASVDATPPAQPAPVQDASKQFHEWAVSEHAAQPACWQGEDGCPNRQACCDAQHCLYTAPPAAPDLQAELEATNRQVEILSDELAESRRELAALKAVQEPESFEQWNAKQHGDPEEIGFLQALRIAYCAGQDSVTKATPPAAQPAAQEFTCSTGLCHYKAQPAVPDAMTSADIQEHIEYVAGWNDYRKAMLEMLK